MTFTDALLEGVARAAGFFIRPDLSIGAQQPPPPPMSTAITPVFRGPNGQIVVPPKWSCPCVLCPSCGARRGPVTLHPADGEVKCFACDRHWTVAIGALPGVHAENAEVYEIFQMIDEDIDLAMSRQIPHYEAVADNAAEG